MNNYTFTQDVINEKDEALRDLKQIVKRGDTIYTVLRHVSKSGMTRHVSLFAIGNDRKPLMIDYLLVKALDYRRVSITKGEGVIVGGSGMDMGFSIVYNLSQKLFDDGYAIKQEWL